MNRWLYFLLIVQSALDIRGVQNLMRLAAVGHFKEFLIKLHDLGAIPGFGDRHLALLYFV